jgi:hypothetical protein
MGRNVTRCQRDAKQRRTAAAGVARSFATIAAAVALACAVSLSLVGCGQAQSQWTKSVEVSSVIKGSSHDARFADGRCITVDVKKDDDVRFVVTVGKVYGVKGWTSGPPRFYYELLAAEDPDTPELPPARVKLDAKITSQSVNEPNDVKSYDLRTAAPLEPGTYNFLYDGAGSVRIAVYSKQ